MHTPIQECPDARTLEHAALDDTAAVSLREHISACPTCSATLEQLRENNRFLGGFTIDGSLPAVLPSETAAGIEIPGYEIVREIHRGGQGVVYQALQRSTNRTVAIKVMKQGPFATLSDRVRFEREIQSLGKLDHSNIVAVHDAGVSGGFHYFVMDYIDGKPLDEWMFDDQRMDATAPPDTPRVRAQQVLSLFIKVCDAVHAAHLRGVIHRDLKPSNIRVDAGNEPHILDFGLAKSVGEQRDTMMTRTGQFVGSLPWAAPEQVEGASDRIDLRSDVYSLGSILYQLLTGVLPFDIGSNLREAVDNILFRQPIRPSTVLARSATGSTALGRSFTGRRSAIDDELDTIVLKCLAKDPDRRYQSAGDIARDLRRYLAGDPIEAKRDSAMYVLRKTLRRYRVQAAAAVAFIVLLAVFAIVMSLLYRRSSVLERQAVDSAQSLSQLLVQSNIEQGRMAGVLGNLDQAERLIWSALLKRGNGDDGSPVLNDPPGPPEAYWALWELYRRRPCLRTLSRATGPTFSSAVADDGRCLWLVDNVGQLVRTDEFGRTIEAIQVGVAEKGTLPMIFARGRVVTVQIRDRTAVFRSPNFDRPSFEVPWSPFSYAGELCVSADGRRLASLLDGIVVVYDVESGSEIARISGKDAPLAATAISDDAQLISARDREGTVSVWRIDDRQRIARLAADLNRGPTRHFAGEMLFSPDGRLLADAWWDSPGRIWDITSDPPRVIDLAESPGTYRFQAFSADGRLLAIGDGGGALHLFDTRSGTRISTMVAHRRRVLSVQFTGDARGIWTGDGSELRLWEVARDASVRIPAIGDDQFHSVDIAPDGRWFAAAGGRGVLHRIDSSTLAVTDTPLENEATISCVAVSSDGRIVAAASYSDRVFLVRTDESREPPIQLPHPNRVSYACFSRDGSRLATSCDDQVLRIWNVAEGKLELQSAALGQRVPRIAFDPSGRRIAAAVRDGRLVLWDIAANRFDTWTPPTMSVLRDVGFSDDGAWLAAAGADRVISIWDASNARLAATLPGHSQEIYCLDISRNGDLIASGDTGGAVRLWHGRLRRPLATLEGHTGSVMDVRFSADGRTLISVGLDGTIRVWDLDYYRRHIAGNVVTQLQRLSVDAPTPIADTGWRDWAGQVESAFAPFE